LLRHPSVAEAILPEDGTREKAVGLLRSVRKEKARGELISISAADPLNLVGILTPGGRITAIRANRILLREGEPIAALEAGQIIKLADSNGTPENEIEQRLKVTRLPATLRLHYG
jgi:ATP-dependent Lhr-like helicase